MLVAVVVWRATSTKKKLCGSPTPVLMEKLTDLTPINQNIVKNTINDFIPKHKNWRPLILCLNKKVWVADWKILKSLFMFAFYHGRPKPGNCVN